MIDFGDIDVGEDFQDTGVHKWAVEVSMIWSGDAFAIASGVPDTSGVESWRRVNHIFNPSTPVTALAAPRRVMAPGRLHGMAVDANMVMSAAEPCPRNKTTGRDRLTTELLTLAMQTSGDMAGAVAWIMNKRLMKHRGAGTMPETAGEERDLGEPGGHLRRW